MLKDLTLEEPNKYPVQSDDLKYDGNQLLIPAYWTDTLLSALHTVDENYFTDGDNEDLRHLIQFLDVVQVKRDSRTQSLIDMGDPDEDVSISGEKIGSSFKGGLQFQSTRPQLNISDELNTRYGLDVAGNHK